MVVTFLLLYFKQEIFKFEIKIYVISSAKCDGEYNVMYESLENLRSLTLNSDLFI